MKKIPTVYYCGDLGYFGQLLRPLYFLAVKMLKWEDFVEKCKNSVVDTLAIDENFLYDKITDRRGINRRRFDQLVELINQNRIRSLLIYIHHPMSMEKEKLLKINELGKHIKISMLTCGGFDFDLKNIKIKNQEVFEIKFHRDRVKALSVMLLRKRKPQLDFMLSTVVKDEFRKEIVNGLLDKDVNIVSNKTSGELFEKIENTRKTLLKKLDNFQSLNYDHKSIVDELITVFGNGPPNFNLYEKYLCELVIETSNSGPWHLTEKTYRPIAFGIPIIFLGHKPMFDTLVKNGYQFHDNDNNFYTHWHSNISLQEKISYLKSFLQSLKNNESRKKLLETASHNYSLFWNNRPFNYMNEQLDFFYDFFGDDVIIEEAYNLLNY